MKVLVDLAALCPFLMLHDLSMTAEQNIQQGSFGVPQASVILEGAIATVERLKSVNQESLVAEFNKVDTWIAITCIFQAVHSVCLWC